jgi:hypothetical protein
LAQNLKGYQNPLIVRKQEFHWMGASREIDATKMGISWFGFGKGEVFALEQL